MHTVTSPDSTTIAYDQYGAGPAVILVGGMFQQRTGDAETDRLAELLAPHFTVLNYDRRGRGDSTDTLPFAVAREIEDIEALIDRVGGTACLFGNSSGAALALEAAAVLGAKVKKLALYEPPYNDDPQARQAWRAFRSDLDAALAAGNRGEAVGTFMSLLGVPADQVAAMRDYPAWPTWEAIAPTMAYDAAALGPEAAVPTDRAAQVTVPTLLIDGADTFPFMHIAADALAQAMPQAQRRTLPGQTHEINAGVLAPVLIEFFED